MPPPINPANEGPFDKSSSNPDDTLLQRILTRRKYMEGAWKDIRMLASRDMEVLVNGPWSKAERQLRKEHGRPLVHLDQLNQHVTALVNEVRQNPVSVKIEPAGSGASDQEAHLRDGRVRAIEYRSNAVQAYETALQCCAERSYGVVTMEVREKSWDSLDQEIWIVKEADPDALLWDPDAKEPDFCDMKDGFKDYNMSIDDFKREYPEATVVDFNPGHAVSAPGWLNLERQTIRVSRYSYIEKKRREVFFLPDGMKVFREDFPQGAQFSDSAIVLPGGEVIPVARRKVGFEPKVMQCLTNGIEILSKTQWAGKRVPIFPMLGRERYWRDGGPTGELRRDIDSYIRQGIGGQQAFDSAKTNQVEAANMAPKITYMMYEGQQDTSTKWEEINRTPKPFATVKPILDEAGATILPLPRREAYEPPIQAMEVMAEGARRAIQAALGSHGFTILDDTNAKTGVAIGRLQSQTDVGKYHFVDSMKTMIAAVGKEINAMLPIIEDTDREVGVRMADGKSSTVQLDGSNRFNDVDSYDVVVSTGPSFQSQRAEAKEIVQSLLNNGLVAPRIADLAIKWINLPPYTDEMAARLKPPDVLTGEDFEKLPPDVKGILAQMQQQMQILEQQNQALMAEKQMKSAELESKEKIAAEDAKVKKMNILKDIRVAEIQALSRTVDTETEAAEPEAKTFEDVLAALVTDYDEEAIVAAQINQASGELMGGQQSGNGN